MNWFPVITWPLNHTLSPRHKLQVSAPQRTGTSEVNVSQVLYLTECHSDDTIHGLNSSPSVNLTPWEQQTQIFSFERITDAFIPSHRVCVLSFYLSEGYVVTMPSTPIQANENHRTSLFRSRPLIWPSVPNSLDSFDWKFAGHLQFHHLRLEARRTVVTFPHIEGLGSRPRRSGAYVPKMKAGVSRPRVCCFPSARLTGMIQC